MDSVPELVWRGYGVVDGLRSLVDVARGSLGGVCSDVFEEVEERWSSMLICYLRTFVRRLTLIITLQQFRVFDVRKKIITTMVLLYLYSSTTTTS